MFEFDLKDNNTFHKIHFIGIGGVSMSGIAELLHAHGFEITGSDREDSDSVQHLVGRRPAPWRAGRRSPD